MSILSQDLHQSILRALRIAREHCHNRATPEHLLLALTDDPDAAPVMRACNVDLEKLRRAVSMYLPRVSESAKVQSSAVDPRTNAGLQSIIQRAVRHVRSVEQDSVTGAHVIVATFAEPAAKFLQQQGMTRYDAVSYVCHGIVKQAGTAASAATEASAISGPTTRSEGKTGGSAYEVVLLNDMYTPMEFVAWVLEEVFPLTRDDAIEIMLSTHRNGSGSCGVYGRAEAQNLAGRLIERAREHQHPLRCILAPPAQRPNNVIRFVARAASAVIPRDVLPNWFRRNAGWPR